ncbi:MAG: cardiolipin synthase [Bacteroidales bacterium]|jgi:cardiolipin synthase|nr:cardiolipin synthase [Bacteroidales bacterium]
MENPRAVNQYAVYDDTLRFYNALLYDIEHASQYIYLEFYRFSYHHLGEEFRDALVKKCKEGVEVKMLLDSWGTSPNPGFFETLTQAGGMVRFFEKFRFRLDYLTRSHRRNHRKIVVIDGTILYLGSANITDYNVVWRELIIRIEGKLAGVFKGVFLSMFELFDSYLPYSQELTTPIFYEGFEILRDVPSISRQIIKKRFVRLIRSARRRIVIETPYFLPSFLVRMALIRAAKRGVSVEVIIPWHSDVRLVDILRNKYLGPMSEKGIKFYMYTPQNLHSKLLLIDNRIFAVGSPNFDYRSFRFQHEIVLVGSDKRLTVKLIEHVSDTLAESVPFNYEKWKKRPFIEKMFEWFIVPFRYLL